MLEFAVRAPWDKEGAGRWVLAVDPVGERLLLTDSENALRWVPMKDCKFLKIKNPEAVQPVMMVQPQQQPPPLALPKLTLNGGRR